MSDEEFENLLERVQGLEGELDEIFERLEELEGDDEDEDTASSIRDEIEDLPDEEKDE